MYKAADFLEIPFQYWIFLIASAINIISGGAVIGGTISLCIRAFAREIARLKQPQAGSADSIEEITKKVIAELRVDLGAEKPVGRVVGIIERELYLYGLILPIHGLITAVLLFKAFSAWLERDDPQETSAKVLDSPGFKDVAKLAKYYSYAIGNFISLAWAIVIFEAIRLVLRFAPCIAELVIIQP